MTSTEVWVINSGPRDRILFAMCSLWV